MIRCLPLWLQIAGILGFVDVHACIFCTGSFSGWHTHPLGFLFLRIGFVFLLALVFIAIVTPAESGTSPGIQSPLLVSPRPLRDLFEEGEPKKGLGSFSVFLLNFRGESGLGVSGRETDESLERSSRQR